MKKSAMVFAVLLVFSVTAHAQMGGGMMGSTRIEMGEQKGEMKPPCMMMGEGQQMPMMQMCMPMMKQMMGQGMMMQDMMQMMQDMMKMQESMMTGMKAEEKKKMMKDMGQMREKMQKMMSMRMGMMMGMDDSQPKLKCAEEWLKKAIDLHELHMRDPKTTTDASQIELMDQIKKAYECVIGKGPEIKVTPSKGPESKEPQKADPHKH